MEEVWKDIIGYEGLYQVSNHGNVKTFGRKSIYGKMSKSKIMKPTFSIKEKAPHAASVVLLDYDKKITRVLIIELLEKYFGFENTGEPTYFKDGNSKNMKPENIGFYAKNSFINQDEIWKPIKDNPRYEISNQGRVYAHRMFAANGKDVKGRIIKPTTIKSGTVRVSLLDKTGITSSHSVWKLMIEAFYGIDVESVTYRDNNPQNLTFDNFVIYDTPLVLVSVTDKSFGYWVPRSGDSFKVTNVNKRNPRKYQIKFAGWKIIRMAPMERKF